MTNYTGALANTKGVQHMQGEKLAAAVIRTTFAQSTYPRAFGQLARFPAVQSAHFSTGRAQSQPPSDARAEPIEAQRWMRGPLNTRCLPQPIAPMNGIALHFVINLGGVATTLGRRAKVDTFKRYADKAEVAIANPGASFVTADVTSLLLRRRFHVEPERGTVIDRKRPAEPERRHHGGDQGGGGGQSSFTLVHAAARRLRLRV